MAFRNIIIENPAHLSLKNEQLVIRTGRENSISIEDIAAILLESRQTTITTAALSRLGQCGCAVFLCDEKHMPCAITLPFAQHSRQLDVLELQLSATVPLKKRVWQAIVRSKISNQAHCLKMNAENTTGDRLLVLSQAVKSGDTGNLEATAAQLYFPALFGKGFVRSYENGNNSALNYGYAILRGYMARTLAVYGFLPALGVHHHNELNAFNLADDFMEPFRPVVDLLVSRTIEPEDCLTPQIKRSLFNCLNLNIISGNQNHSVAYAMERMVQSYLRLLNGKSEEIYLPKLVELEQHRYE